MTDRFTLTQTTYNSPAVYDAAKQQLASSTTEEAARGALDVLRSGTMPVEMFAWRELYVDEVPTESRPSENQDAPPHDKLFAAAAEYGRTHLGWTDDPEPDDLAVLALRYVGGPGPSTVELDVQKAQAYATLALVEQQRETNRHLDAIAREMRSTRVVGL